MVSKRQGEATVKSVTVERSTVMGNEGQLAEDKGNENWKEDRCVQRGN